MKKIRLLSLALIGHLALGSVNAEPKTIIGAEFAFPNCGQVILPGNAYVFHLDITGGSAELLVQENDLELTTRILTFVEGRQIVFVVDAYYNGRGINLPLKLVRDGHVEWQGIINSVRGSRSNNDLERTVLSYTLPREVWSEAFPEPGLYKLIAGQEVATNALTCQTSIETWILAGSATRATR